jgi:hypothetical protein
VFITPENLSGLPFHFVSVNGISILSFQGNSKPQYIQTVLNIKKPGSLTAYGSGFCEYLFEIRFFI